MSRGINFNDQCSVYLICEDKGNVPVKLVYERPQSVDDETLTNEALDIFQDARTRELGNVSKLCGIFIARNAEQDALMEAKSITIL